MIKINEIIQNHQKFLLLRYSNKIKKDCIAQHTKLIDSIGYCWFGKIGNVPSEKILNAVFSEDHPVIVLYKSNAAYIGNVADYTTKSPTMGVPLYYNELDVFPSVYFKIESLIPCDNEILHDSIVVSTGTFVDDSIYHSRIPFMLCEYIDSSQLEQLGPNECRYLKRLLA